MKQYATEQRQQLLAFLKAHQDKQFSVEEIATALCAYTEISVSSVYRNINKMVKDGDIARHALDGSRKFVYQYVGNEDCRNHLHLKCEDCGRLIHLNDRLSEQVLDAAVLNNDFHINKKKTVLYGSCAECNTQGSGNDEEE